MSSPVLVDSHCHLDMLDLERLGMTLPEAIAFAKTEGVAKILSIGVDLANAPKVIAIAEKFDHVYASAGIHPSEKLDEEPTIDEYRVYAKHPKVVAIGETGLDYYYNDSGLEQQRKRFRLQIQLSRELKKPIIVHTRDAKEDTISIMREEQADEVGGVMHCFTEDYDMAKQALDLGFYISFSGIVTFKNAENVRDVARKVPLDRMLIETDAPYLTPTPFRGKPNQPARVRQVAEFLAELRGVEFDVLASITTNNFHQLFGI